LQTGDGTRDELTEAARLDHVPAKKKRNIGGEVYESSNKPSRN